MRDRQTFGLVNPHSYEDFVKTISKQNRLPLGFPTSNSGHTPTPSSLGLRTMLMSMVLALKICTKMAFTDFSPKNRLR